MNITVVSVEPGAFDDNFNVTYNVILTDSYLTIKGNGVVWKNYTDEELEVIFHEWLIYAKEGDDGFCFV